MKKILLMTSNNINGNPRPNRLLKFMIQSNYSVDLLSYNKYEGDVKQYFFKKKLNIDLINLILYLRLYKLNKDLLLFDSVDLETQKELINNNYDLIICENIELIYLAFKLKSFGTKIMIDLREYFPTHFDNNIAWRLRKKEYYKYLLNKYVRKTNKILTVSDGIAKEYNTKYNLDCETYLSLPEKQDKKSEIKDSYEVIRIVHHGIASPNRNLESMIYMMDYLDENKYILDLYLVKLNNSCYDDLINLSINRKNVNILEPVKYSDINIMLIRYDIGLYLLKDDSFNHKYALPNKLFEFIQAGLCLAFSPIYESVNIINKYNVGFVSDNYESENMANKIKGVSESKLNEYKRNSRTAAEILNSGNNNKKMDAMIKELLF